MILKDVAPNMEDYLENKCYCPGEIYDDTGIFFMTFTIDDSCSMLVKDGAYKDEKVTAVLCKDQIICFWLDSKGEVVEATRYDATENNKSELTAVLTGVKTKIKIDTFKNTITPEELMKQLGTNIIIKD